MELQIREIEIKDYEFITGLSYQLGYKTTNENTLKWLIEIKNNKDNCVLVTLDKDRIIGWIHAFYTIRLESGPFIEIGGMVIDENYRRMGIGKILVDRIIDWFAFKKCSKLRARCNKTRIETHEFYKAIGFNEVKEQKIFDKQLD